MLSKWNTFRQSVETDFKDYFTTSYLCNLSNFVVPQFSHLQKKDNNVDRGTARYKRDRGFGTGPDIWNSINVTSLTTSFRKDLSELHENLHEWLILPFIFAFFYFSHKSFFFLSTHLLVRYSIIFPLLFLHLIPPYFILSSGFVTGSFLLLFISENVM